MSWGDILTHWDLVEADLHQHYGIDADDRALMRARSWRWLQARITGLLSIESRLQRALSPDDSGESTRRG
ncbi:hypothetical protein EDC02_5944 [Micromonospora sp. Llam0]|nr:hypothetical protein [Micromonospora sp. Llam0]ROO51080.1 hypothetical protein EDC02_5944 [Micromonospora sp. Llam0]